MKRRIAKTMHPLLALVALAALVLGCAAPQRASLEQLRTRSAFDLSCHPQMLHLYHIDERTKGVVGCGRRLTYVESCDGVGARDVCTWMLDQPPLNASPPVPAAYGWRAPVPPPAPGDIPEQRELRPQPAAAESAPLLDPFEDRH